jgi:hypothetical protein
MSSVIYGTITRKRLEAPPGASTGDTTPAQPPALKTYVDAVAALVPAEVLAVQAFITGLIVSTVTAPNGSTATKITNPTLLRISFFALLALAILAYFAGLRRWPNGLDYVRMLIPPVAFACWTGLQTNTAFDVMMPAFAGVPAMVTSVIVATALGFVAKMLGVSADNAQAS